MRHDLHLTGHAFALRPVAVADAAFIVEVRAQGGRFLNRGAATVAEQRKWIELYFARPGDCYFVVESRRDATPEGLVGIYDIDPQARAAEWGRWVLRPGSPAAVESALLVYRCAFGPLALERVVCRTLADNTRVVAFHDSCGLARAPAPITITQDGQPRAAVEHALDRAGWPAVEARLDRLAQRVAVARGPSA